MPLPNDSGNKNEGQNKRNLAAQKRQAARFEFAQTGVSNQFQPSSPDESTEGDEADIDDEEFEEVDDKDETNDRTEGHLQDDTQKDGNNDDRTTGDIEHEKALAGRLDRQKGLEEQTKSMQGASQKAEGAPLDATTADAGQARGDKTKNAEANAGTLEQQNEQENARALQQDKRAAMAAQPQGQQPPATQPNQQQAGQTPEQGVGMMHNVQRLMKKGFSCTGCIGTIIRLLLDYVGAFYVYVFLDGLIKEDNTDRVFTGAYCLTMLIQLLILLSPIIIAVALASAAGYLLNGLVDIDTILNFIK